MLALYRIHICIAWYAVKSWHNKYSNTFKELQYFQLWAWQGVGRGGAWGVREDAENSWWGRSMEKFSLYQQKQRHCTIRLMFFREFECIRLVTKATPTRIALTHTHRHSRSGSEKARKCCCKCNWPKVPSVRVEERDSSLLPRGMLTRCSATPPLSTPTSPSPLTSGQRVCCVDWNVSPARAI